jgi:hypothetical protein
MAFWPKPQMGSNQRQAKPYRRPGVRKRGPVQAKLGRVGGQSKFEQIDTTKLMADIARGVPVQIACAAVGISRDTFYAWLDERPLFAQALAAEKQRVILEALDAVKGCSTKEREFRQWTWFLETVYRDYFAPPDKAALAFTQNNFTISFEKARQIEETRAKLLPEVHAMLGLTNGQTNGSEPRT